MKRKLRWHTHTREAPPPAGHRRTTQEVQAHLPARRHSHLPMRHREPWQGLVHATLRGGFHPQVLIVLSTPATTSEQAAQTTPALFGLGMFINILFISSNYPSQLIAQQTSGLTESQVCLNLLFIFQVPGNGHLLLCRYRDSDKHDIANHGGDTTNHQPTTRLASRVWQIC